MSPRWSTGRGRRWARSSEPWRRPTSRALGRRRRSRPRFLRPAGDDRDVLPAGSVVLGSGEARARRASRDRSGGVRAGSRCRCATPAAASRPGSARAPRHRRRRRARGSATRPAAAVAARGGAGVLRRPAPSIGLLPVSRTHRRCRRASRRGPRVVMVTRNSMAHLRCGVRRRCA